MKERVNIATLPTSLIAELVEAKKFGKTAEILAKGMEEVKEEEMRQKVMKQKDKLFGRKVNKDETIKTI